MVPVPVPGTLTWKCSASHAMPGARRRWKASPGTCCPWPSGSGVAIIVGHLIWRALRGKRGERAGTVPFLNMSHQQSPATAGNRDGDSPHRREGDSPLITRHAPIDRRVSLDHRAGGVAADGQRLPAHRRPEIFVGAAALDHRAGAHRRRAVPPGAGQFLPAPAVHGDRPARLPRRPAPGAAPPSTRWRRSSCMRCSAPQCWSRPSPASSCWPRWTRRCGTAIRTCSMRPPGAWSTCCMARRRCCASRSPWRTSYFSLLPEKRAYLRAMIGGQMTRAEAAEFHDPQRWSGPAQETIHVKTRHE